MSEKSLDSLPGVTDVVRRDRQRDLGLEVIRMSDVKPRPIDWLWPSRIALGKVHVLAGEGGQGKSTILCDLAGCTSRGERWPDGSANEHTGSVIILAAEDDVEDTLSPRLRAIEADQTKVHCIRSALGSDGKRRTFNLQADLGRLAHLIEELGDVRLVIIDPVSSYLAGIDSHKNAEVRSVLEPLGDLAARYRVAVICNNHFAKGGASANSRVIGSVAFVNQARAAFIVAPDAEEHGRYLLLPSKTNIGPMTQGLGYRIEGVLLDVDGTEILTSRVCWDNRPVTITADQALAAVTAKIEGRSARSQAEDFLRDVLAGGPMPSNDIKEAQRRHEERQR